MTTTLDTTRRGVLAGGIAAAALTLHSTSASNTARVSGFVYDVTDAARSGAHGLGAANVQVSNGRDIALTDRNGRWELPARIGEHVFVVKPDDWDQPRAVGGQHAFAHRVAASGSPMLYDFTMRRVREPRSFDVALLADTQPQSDTELGYLRDSILPAVIDTDAAFVINHGDILFDRPDLYRRYTDLVSGTGMPWHHCPGNHDMNHGGPHTCFEDWKRTFGPCHMAFHYGGATFILLNNVERLPDGALTPGGYDYRGMIGADQLAFVAALLATLPPERLVVVSMHIPLVSAHADGEPASLTADRAALLSLLSGRPNTLSLAGHMHTTEHHYLGREHGFAGPDLHHHHVLTAACGSWWSGPLDNASLPTAVSSDGTPKGFHILSVDGTSYSTKYVAVGHTGHPQMSIGLEGAAHGSAQAQGASRAHCERVIASHRCSSMALAINVFDGGPRTSVELTVKKAGVASGRAIPLPATRSAAPDAAVAGLFRRHRDVVKPWVEASPCSHLWRAPLPPLDAGTYVASVAVTDQYQRRHASSLVFEVTA